MSPPQINNFRTSLEYHNILLSKQLLQNLLFRTCINILLNIWEMKMVDEAVMAFQDSATIIFNIQLEM
jgi:hypothetical protein